MSDVKEIKGTSTCAVCKIEETSKVCGGCHIKSYCSRKCQEADWLDHQEVCMYEYVPPPNDWTEYKHPVVVITMADFLVAVPDILSDLVAIKAKKISLFSRRRIHLRFSSTIPTESLPLKMGPGVLFATTSLPDYFVKDWLRYFPSRKSSLQLIFDAPLLL